MASKLPQRRRPPSRQAIDLNAAAASPAPQQPPAGGPSTRGATPLGRVLAEFLAYFEVRTVSTREIELLRPTHENGWLRPQVEAKLKQLHPTCPDHQELRRLVLLSIELLSAVDAGRFKPGPEWPELEPRLLRALAYFVRDGDAIPDDLPHGFDDDMREFQVLAERAGHLLGMFEAVQARDQAARASRR